MGWDATQWQQGKLLNGGNSTAFTAKMGDIEGLRSDTFAIAASSSPIASSGAAGGVFPVYGAEFPATPNGSCPVHGRTCDSVRSGWLRM